MRRLIAISIMTLAVTGSVSAGNIDRCADKALSENLVQTECLEMAAKTGLYARPSQYAQADYNPYSIMNQAKQVEIDRNNRDIKRRQKMNDHEKRQNKSDRKERQRRSDVEKCERYKSNAHQEYLSDERKRYYRKLAAEYCK